MAQGSWSINRTELRRACDIVDGDHILDPDSRHPRMLTVWMVERLGDVIYLHATLRRSVVRKVFWDTPIDVCVPNFEAARR